ncbi:MAG: hypothetical protein ACAH88_05695 [Roseimicrobium sp.]
MPNLIMLLDDIAVSPPEYKAFEATKGSELDKAVNLYGGGSTYADWTKFSDLYNDKPLRAELDPAAKQFLDVALRPAIHGSIMEQTQSAIFGLDRMEVEANYDFVYSKEADTTFEKTVSNAPWHGLDLDELEKAEWSDEARVNLLLSYKGPLHLEKRIRNDKPDYRLRNQPFMEIYMETDDGLLASHALSLRARLRPEQDRGLIQMKLELPPNEVTKLPVRQKWERRFRGTTYLADLDYTIDQLLVMTRFGFIAGIGMPELKKLFDILVSKGALAADGELTLRPDHVIYQQRMRARLEHDTLDVVKARLALLSTMASEEGVHPNLVRFLKHVEAQAHAFEACEAAITRHTKDNETLGGECVIISWDRWSAYEPGAAKFGTVPDGLNKPGIRGRGLRVETELDAWTTQPIDEALETIAKKRAEGQEDPAQLDLDEKAIKYWQLALWQDVKLTCDMMLRDMESAGVPVSTETPSSKSEQAVRMMAEGQEGFRRGHRYWW